MMNTIIVLVFGFKVWLFSSFLYKFLMIPWFITIIRLRTFVIYNFECQLRVKSYTRTHLMIFQCNLNSRSVLYFISCCFTDFLLKYSERQNDLLLWRSKLYEINHVVILYYMVFNTWDYTWNYTVHSLQI